MIIYIAWYLTRMLYSERDNKIVLKTLDPRGNLHFIGWKRFEAVCCRRLKRMAIKKERDWSLNQNEIRDFSFWSTEWKLTVLHYNLLLFPISLSEKWYCKCDDAENSCQNVKLFFLRISFSCHHLVIRNTIKLYRLCIIKYHTP